MYFFLDRASMAEYVGAEKVGWTEQDNAAKRRERKVNSDLMRKRKVALSETQGIPPWRVCLTKLKGSGKNPRGGYVLGEEYASPHTGCPYLVYLKRGGLFQTSLVQEIRKVGDGVVIKTRNSVYHIAYLGLKDSTDESIDCPTLS
jgi:hypothetical protein